MKSQNDMIFSIAAITLAVIAGAIFFFTKPEVAKLPDPQPVPTAPAQFTPGAVTMANSLPGGGGGGGTPAAPAASAGAPASGGGNLGSMKNASRPGGGGGAGAPVKGNPSKQAG